MSTTRRLVSNVLNPGTYVKGTQPAVRYTSAAIRDGHKLGVNLSNNEPPTTDVNKNNIMRIMTRLVYLYIAVAIIVIIATLVSLCVATDACKSSYFNVGGSFHIFGQPQEGVGMYIGLSIFFFISAALQTLGSLASEGALFGYWYMGEPLDNYYNNVIFYLNGKWTVYIMLTLFNIINSFFYILNLIGATSNIIFFICTSLGVILTRCIADSLRIFYNMTPNRDHLRNTGDPDHDKTGCTCRTKKRVTNTTIASEYDSDASSVTDKS
jgi:hypothetical protein